MENALHRLFGPPAARANRCRGSGVNRNSVAQASQAAEKCALRPSGVQTPEENTAFMSCLKARPTNLATLSTAGEACSTKNHDFSIVPIRRDRQRHGFPGQSSGHLIQRVPLHVQYNSFK